MRRESHVRFCEGPGVQFPRATRLVIGVEIRLVGRSLNAGCADMATPSPEDFGTWANSGDGTTMSIVK